MSALTKEVEGEVRRLFAGMPFAAGAEGAVAIIKLDKPSELQQETVIEALKALQHTLESVAEEYNERGRVLMEHAATRRAIGDFLVSVVADAKAGSR